MYYEARSVLYQSNTFVFPGLATFATYFGLVFPRDMDDSCFYISRSTDPYRLRAIHAMTRLEIDVTISSRVGFSFLSASRLIRAGLGCLVSLTSLELMLSNSTIDGDWIIDDSMFSKPSSLKKLLVGVRILDLTIDGIPLWGMSIKDAEHIGSELVHRICCKQEGFSDTKELLWSYNEPITPPESST